MDIFFLQGNKLKITTLFSIAIFAHYSLPPPRFRMDPLTGWIYVANPLDREAVQSYSLGETDSGPHFQFLFLENKLNYLSYNAQINSPNFQYLFYRKISFISPIMLILKLIKLILT